MSKTKLMGILNVSADSFYSESRAPSGDQAFLRAMKLQEQGADIIDVGGRSTRPGAPPVDEQEELRRLTPVFAKLKGALKVPMSIDTTRPRVAKFAIEAGATMVNDISGVCDRQMVDLIVGAGVDVCVMHMRGTPLTMQSETQYSEGVVEHLLHWFRERTDSLLRDGVDPDKIVIDPGIGFAKEVEDNFRILHSIDKFKKLGFRVLVGISRKSFMGKIINKQTSQLLAATLAVNTQAILAGVDIIRVHDVEEHRDIIDLLAAIAEMR